MRSIKNILLLLAGVAFFLTACDKVADLPSYNDATAPVLTADKTTIASLPADSNNVALRLSWTDARHSTDSANVKYTIEIDSAGKNFTRPTRFVVMGNQLARTFTAKELNNMLLGYNYPFNVPVDMDVRVISSYANNNEPKASNTVRIKMTPYKVPPKVPLPTTGKLFLVGGATQGGWNNPVPTPAQEFARLDETTFAGVFQLNGGSEYLVLPENGVWSKKYALENNTLPGIENGGVFGYHVDGQPAPDPYTQNFKGPAANGWYKIVLDFQQGRFTVTPYVHALPTDLFIVGDATAGGWNNPVPVATQKFTRVNSSVWEITLPLTGTKEFLVLPENGAWNKKFALSNNTVTGIRSGGEFGYHVDGQPQPDPFTQNFVSPTANGTYKITLNFAAPTTQPGASGRFTIAP